MRKHSPEPRRKPEVGDMALHKSNRLDSRPVAEVSADGKQVWLDFGAGFVSGPFPANNYTFKWGSR